MTPDGFIDVHSHLLPGIDDGCVSVEESLTCVRKLKAHGFAGTICTPHACVSVYPENTPPAIARHAEALRSRLSETGLDYQIWTGAEVRLAAGTMDWFRRHGVPTLASSRCVLIDYWGGEWPPFCDEIVAFLLDDHYQPVLAHPERMKFRDEKLEPLLCRLQQAGVWMQGNLRCVTGAEGPGPQSRIQRWLAEDRYDLLATDMHAPDCLDERLRGISLARQRIGAARLTALLGNRIREMSE